MGPVRGGGFGGGRGFGGNRGKKNSCLESILDIALSSDWSFEKKLSLYTTPELCKRSDQNIYVACLHVTNLEVEVMCPLVRSCD
jgi:hypothetical protein